MKMKKNTAPKKLIEIPRGAGAPVNDASLHQKATQFVDSSDLVPQQKCVRTFVLAFRWVAALLCQANRCLLVCVLMCVLVYGLYGRQQEICRQVEGEMNKRRGKRAGQEGRSSVNGMEGAYVIALRG